MRYFAIILVLTFASSNMFKKKPERINLSIENFQLKTDSLNGTVNGEPYSTVMNTYESEITMFDKAISLRFDPDELEIELSQFISKVENNINWIQENKKVINKAIIREMLSLKNEVWLDENESIVGEKEFLKRIFIADITFFDDSSFEIYYNDGDLFWGHVIIVCVTNELHIDEIKLGG